MSYKFALSFTPHSNLLELCRTQFGLQVRHHSWPNCIPGTRPKLKVSVLAFHRTQHTRRWRRWWGHRSKLAAEAQQDSFLLRIDRGNLPRSWTLVPQSLFFAHMSSSKGLSALVGRALRETGAALKRAGEAEVRRDVAMMRSEMNRRYFYSNFSLWWIHFYTILTKIFIFF